MSGAAAGTGRPSCPRQRNLTVLDAAVEMRWKLREDSAS
jgi:hypothetical protein